MFYKDFIKLKTFSQFRKFPNIRLSDIVNFYEFIPLILEGDNHWHYSGNFITNEISTDARFKYGIIEMEDNDSILFTFKYIQILHNKVIFLINAPVSLNNNTNNVLKVIDHLSSLNFVKGVIKHKDLHLFSKWDIDIKVKEDEYYTYIPVWKDKFNRGKWKAKQRVNWTLNDKDFLFREATYDDIPNLINFLESWINYKETNLNEKVTSSKVYYNLINAIDTCDNVKVYVLLYKNQIIATHGYTIFRNTADQIMNLSISRTNHIETDDRLRKIFACLTHQMTWYSYNILDTQGIEYIYCGNGVSDKGMATYKSQCNTDKYEYAKIIPRR